MIFFFNNRSIQTLDSNGAVSRVFVPKETEKKIEIRETSTKILSTSNEFPCREKERKDWKDSIIIVITREREREREEALDVVDLVFVPFHFVG